MKTTLFNRAIINCSKIRFLYGIEETIVEPYMVTVDRAGNKVIYARDTKSNVLQRYEYSKIVNIKILEGDKFSPVAQLSPYYN